MVWRVKNLKIGPFVLWPIRNEEASKPHYSAFMLRRHAFADMQFLNPRQLLSLENR